MLIGSELYIHMYELASFLWLLVDNCFYVYSSSNASDLGISEKDFIFFYDKKVCKALKNTFTSLIFQGFFLSSVKLIFLTKL